MRQLIIARKDLQMSPGKLAAQCCHASLAFLTDPIGMGQGVELHETEFYQCDLRKADFRDAAGYKVDILGSRLKDAKFSLPEAVNLLADLRIKLS